MRTSKRQISNYEDMLKNFENVPKGGRRSLLASWTIGAPFLGISLISFCSASALHVNFGQGAPCSVAGTQKSHHCSKRSTALAT